MMKLLVTVLLSLCLLQLAEAQVRQQHPYRQISLRTRIRVESSREKDARYRYSAWGNLSSSDRRYTQKVRLRIIVTNVSGIDLEDIRVQYRVYKRSLDRSIYSVAASGDIRIPQIESNKSKTVFTDYALCQYRLQWNKLARGNRLSRSGEKYAGYVVIYCDRKGPVCWDMSSGTMYAEYANELRMAKELQTESDSFVSEKKDSLPYSAGIAVYVTRTGRKFHRKSCRFVSASARPLSREEAVKSGYAPCSVCKP